VTNVNNYRVVLEEILKLTHQRAALNGDGAGSVVKMISVNSYRVVLEEILKLTHQGAALNVNGVASVVEDQ